MSSGSSGHWTVCAFNSSSQKPGVMICCTALHDAACLWPGMAWHDHRSGAVNCHSGASSTTLSNHFPLVGFGDSTGDASSCRQALYPELSRLLAGAEWDEWRARLDRLQYRPADLAAFLEAGGEWVARRQQRDLQPRLVSDHRPAPSPPEVCRVVPNEDAKLYSSPLSSAQTAIDSIRVAAAHGDAAGRGCSSQYDLRNPQGDEGEPLARGSTLGSGPPSPP